MDHLEQTGPGHSPEDSKKEKKNIKHSGDIAFDETVKIADTYNPALQLENSLKPESLIREMPETAQPVAAVLTAATIVTPTVVQ